MHTSNVQAAVDAAKSTARALGLAVDDATVLQNSNRLALRLLPCNVLARVAPLTHQAGAEFEVEVARRLGRTTSPVAELESRVEPRAYPGDSFVVTFWAYYEPLPPRRLAPEEYARALERLHAGMRVVDLPVPHFTDRVVEAQRLVGDRCLTPELAEPDRQFLGDMLQRLGTAIFQGGAAEQLLHGEPHPGNVLRAESGLLFVDLETCCRGPVEFDVAHAPAEVSDNYADLDRGLLADCRTLALAMVAAWRWNRDDQFPDRRQMGTDLLRRLRAIAGPQGPTEAKG